MRLTFPRAVLEAAALDPPGTHWRRALGDGIYEPHEDPPDEDPDDPDNGDDDDDDDDDDKDPDDDED